MKSFLDVHSHILPRFDDGSKSSDESLEMLKALHSMGARGVIATPHFYAGRDEPGEFINARESTAKYLVSKIEECVREKGEYFPDVYLGAEVEYFPAISICSELDKMCISGTNYLLCEMPFYKWTLAMFNELLIIKKKRGITPIIAHVERHLSFFHPAMLDEMIAEGFLIQSNAESFTRLGKTRVLNLLAEGKIHLLGSDCHNMGKRPPNMSAAFEIINKRIGAEAIDKLCNKSLEVFENAEPIYRAGQYKS